MSAECCMRPAAGKVLLVANSLPFNLKRDDKTGKLTRAPRSGDLGSTVVSAVIQNKGIWIGSTGLERLKLNERIPEPEKGDTTPSAGLTRDMVVSVDLEPSIFEKHFRGCCVDCLWPLIHSMPDKASFNADSWQAYQEVNSKFAAKTVDTLADLAKGGKETQAPIVWIQDYHLMLVANSIRLLAAERGLAVKIGFFLHTPFPAWDVFRVLPWSEEVLQGLLACDLVAFQAESHKANFIDSCYYRLSCRVDREAGLVEHGSHACAVRVFPLGVPYEQLERLAAAAKFEEGNGQKIILNLDTLDYTKGLLHGLRAFEKLLEEYPEHSEKVQFLQIVESTQFDIKENQSLKEEINAAMSNINARFSTAKWSPVQYVYGTVSRERLVTYNKNASVALVSPLRDGMSLVAKEFVACQTKSPPGVLVLSPFSGAAETMKEALSCNPYQINEAAAVLNKALLMPDDERTIRMNFLKRREKANSTQAWFRSFTQELAKVKETKPSFKPVTIDEIDRYMSDYVGDCKKLALLLDYDGTLSPLCSHPSLAVLPAETRKVLESLAKMPQVFIAIISGRNVNNVKELVGIEGLTYAGNHGLEILHPDGQKYTHHMPPEFERKAEELFKALEEKVCRSGAWLERKGALMTFHYRETPAELVPQIVAEAKALIAHAGFKGNSAHCAIEAKPPVQWHKGRAAAYIVCKEFGMDWTDRVRVVFAGDDTTDEDAMEVLKGIGATFRIAPTQIVKSWAEHRIPSTLSIVTLLQWIERHFSKKR